MKRELEYLNNVLHDNDCVIVACSGGPDSMCLLDLVNKVNLTKNLKIIVAHVNHNLRKNSEKEEVLVRKFAEVNNNIFEVIKLDFKEKTFTEELGRQKRYQFFEELIDKYQANALLTAHHGDDLIETVLMRITRGSNLSGYIGIKKYQDNGKYLMIRPLLNIGKCEIVKYLDDLNISYAWDESNDKDTHTRNRFRHEVLPFLYNENPLVVSKFNKFSEELIQYNDFVNNYILKQGIIQDDKINLAKIDDEFILKKSIELLIKNVQAKDHLEISDNCLNELMKIARVSNKTIDLNNNYLGINSYGKLYIEKKDKKAVKPMILDKDIVVNNYYFCYNNKEFENSNACIALNSNEIKLPLVIRFLKPADRMEVKNLNGTKKVSDIFIDNKVPRHKRDKYPILVDSSDTILWIPNIKKSKFAKKKEEIYDIIINCEAR